MPNASEKKVVEKEIRPKKTTRKQHEVAKRKAYYSETGTSPLDFRLYPMTEMKNNEVIHGFLCRLFINSPTLKLLPLEVYDVCTNTVATGAQLSLWQFKKIEKLIEGLTAQGKTIPMITVYVPVKMVLGETVKKEYNQFMDELSPEIAEHICFAFTSEILFAEATRVERAISRIKEKGIHCAFLSFGEDYYPPLRLKSLSVDYVYYAPEFSSRLLRGEKEAEILSEMAQKLGYKRVAQFWSGEAYETPEGSGSEKYPADYKLFGAGYSVEDIIGSNE